MYHMLTMTLAWLYLHLFGETQDRTPIFQLLRILLHHGQSVAVSRVSTRDTDIKEPG